MKKEYLVSAQQMKQYDHNTIEYTKLPSLVLMERAAYDVAKCVMEALSHNKAAPILILAGNGNNGADAVAAGRILKEFGYAASIYQIPSKQPWNENLMKQLEIAKQNGVTIDSSFSPDKYEILVDGIFGIGLDREVKGAQKDVISECNRLHKKVISVDIPSGIHATTGCVMGVAICADITVTFGFLKRGLFLLPGKQYAGHVMLSVMGINESSFYGTKPELFTYYDNGKRKQKIDLCRPKDGNKGTFGKILMISGRDNTPGACILSTKSALHSGCGMVSVVTGEKNRELIIQEIPEVMIHSIEQICMNGKIHPILQWADITAVGPGLGTDDCAKEIMELLLFHSECPLILDADALTILAEADEYRNRLIQKRKESVDRRPLIMTPHIGEFSRLFSMDVEKIKENRLEYCKMAAEEYHAVMVLKDDVTFVCNEEGMCYMNTTGCDALAKAGSGDVLTGLIASLAAQYSKKDQIPYEEDAPKEHVWFYASCMAVFIHGKAGELAGRRYGNGYVTAGDLIRQYSALFV